MRSEGKRSELISEYFLMSNGDFCYQPAYRAQMTFVEPQIALQITFLTYLLSSGTALIENLLGFRCMYQGIIFILYRALKLISDLSWQVSGSIWPGNPRFTVEGVLPLRFRRRNAKPNVLPFCSNKKATI